MREPRSHLESELAHLPEPEAPAGLTAAVMARVARVDPGRLETAADAAEETRRPGVLAGGENPFRGGGRLAAALAAAGLAGYVYGLERGAWTSDAPASPIADGLTALAALPQSVPAAIALTTMLLLYLRGLLAPLGIDPHSTASTDRPRHPRKNGG